MFTLNAGSDILSSSIAPVTSFNFRNGSYLNHFSANKMTQKCFKLWNNMKRRKIRAFNCMSPAYCIQIYVYLPGGLSRFMIKAKINRNVRTRAHRSICRWANVWFAIQFLINQWHTGGSFHWWSTHELRPILLVNHKSLRALKSFNRSSRIVQSRGQTKRSHCSNCRAYDKQSS